MIELAKKSSSNDNISIIAVFFKDPQQIVSEYKAQHSINCTQMEYETNGVGSHFDDSLMARPAGEHELSAASADDHMDFGKATATSTASAATPPIGGDHADANAFFFGTKNNGGIDPLMDATPGYKSNGDGDRFSSTDANDIEHGLVDEHDDFGPETDVDATDDTAISPISSSVSRLSNAIVLAGTGRKAFGQVCDLESFAFPSAQQRYDFIEKASEDAGVTDGLQTNIVDDIVKKADADADFQHPFDDNRFVDHHFVSSTTTDVSAAAQGFGHFYDDEPELRNKMDFAEKEAYREWLHLCLFTKSRACAANCPCPFIRK